MYKIGDRVVWVSFVTGYKDCRGTITKVENKEIHFINETYPSTKSEWDYEENFIHEHIYDSPLYKALKEEK